MIQVKSFTFNPFEENTYILFDETGEAVVVDPGCYEKEEEKELSDFISGKKLKVSLLLNTHCHIDHVLGNYYVKERYKVPFLVPAGEMALLRAVKSYAPNYGFHHYQEAIPDGPIAEGKNIEFGNASLEVLFLPGHSPGHVGFFIREQNILISGDVLFYRSVGRTDLPGGDVDTLLTSIHQKLFSLPDAVLVYSGHGPATTIGDEKIHNPFCAITV